MLPKETKLSHRNNTITEERRHLANEKSEVDALPGSG